ncbi:hypothetical protein C3L33_23209, partial [Rhododendron williamsianum]
MLSSSIRRWLLTLPTFDCARSSIPKFKSVGKFLHIEPRDTETTELFFEVEMDLIGSICNKWNGLVSMRLLYSVCDHRNILLGNDDDFHNMMDLAAAYGARCVEVSVEDGNSRVSSRFEISESSRSNGNGGITSSSHSEIVEDPLEKFCPHHETKRLAADWVYLISHVGQEFSGGVKDFRLCLCKYAIEVGFRFKYLKNDQSRETAECAFKADGCK